MMDEETASVRKYSRRWFLGGTLGGGLASAAGVRLATERPGPPPPGPPRLGPPRPGPLVVSTGTASATLLRELVEQWNDEKPHTPAVVEDVGESTGAQYKAMRARAEQGWGDILLLDSIYVSEFATNKWISAVPDDLIRDDILAGPRSTCHRLPGEKEIFAVPFNTDVGVIFAHEAFESGRSIDLPTLLDTIPPDSGQLIGQFGAPNEAFLVNVLEHAVGREDKLLSNDGTLTLELDVWLRALGPLTEALQSDKIYRAKDEIAAADTFWSAKKRPYMRNWPFRGAGPGRSQPPPVARMARGVLGGQNLAVVANSPRQEQAMELIGRLTTPQSQQTLVSHRLVPVDQRTFDNPDLLMLLPHLPVVLAGVQAARPRPISPYYKDLSSALQRSLGYLISRPGTGAINQDSMDGLKRVLDGRGP